MARRRAEMPEETAEMGLNGWDAPKDMPADVPEAVEDMAENVSETVAAAVESVPVTVDGPMDAGVSTDIELKDELTAILGAPRGKNCLPVMSMYTGEAGFKRYFLLDVDPDAYMRAWNLYYDRVGTYDPNGFLLMVYDIIRSGLPRLYRAVAWTPLERRE